MKRYLQLLLALCAIPQCQAQLYVSPGSYVYANDQYLFVRQDVNLQNNGNLYLRNGSQLLQGTNTTSTNQGQGQLSVFQEGTVDNFEYNYWCSPVGGALATSGNSSFGITQLYMPTGLTSSTAAVMLPTSSLNGIASPLSIAQRWVFKYTASNDYASWVQVNSASTIAAGEGFTMKGTSGTDMTMVQSVANNPGANQRYDFRGKPNDGNIGITVGNGVMTLTGNPYPSAIDLAAFLVAETNCTGSAYFWEQDKTVNSHLLMAYQGGYGTYSGGTNIYVPAVFSTYNIDGTTLASVGSGNAYARRFSPVGQGFMIEGTTNGTVMMRNGYRVFVKENATTSVFERMAANAQYSQPEAAVEFLPAIPSVSGFDYTAVSVLDTPQIRFNVQLNGTGIRQMVLAFKDEATDGFDHAMDSKSPSEDIPADMFFPIEDKKYVINATNFDVNKKIPVGTKNAADAMYRIVVNEMVNFTGAEHVYLHDKVADIYHEITSEAYEFNMPAGTDTNRWEITFTTQALGTSDLVKGNLAVLQDNVKETLSVLNPQFAEIREIALFDITGKLLWSKKNQGSSERFEFPTSGLSESVYIVRISPEGKQAVSQKIIVSHQSSIR